MIKISTIPGINKQNTQGLEKLGIISANDLLQAGQTPSQRKKIAYTLAVSVDTIEKWVNIADLSRVKGIGVEYAQLLNAIKVSSAEKLSQQEPVALLKALSRENSKSKIVAYLPSGQRLEGWIKKASRSARMKTKVLPNARVSEESQISLTAKTSKTPKVMLQAVKAGKIAKTTKAAKTAQIIKNTRTAQNSKTAQIAKTTKVAKRQNLPPASRVGLGPDMGLSLDATRSFFSGKSKRVVVASENKAKAKNVFKKKNFDNDQSFVSDQWIDWLIWLLTFLAIILLAGFLTRSYLANPDRYDFFRLLSKNRSAKLDPDISQDVVLNQVVLDADQLQDLRALDGDADTDQLQDLRALDGDAQSDEVAQSENDSKQNKDLVDLDTKKDQQSKRVGFVQRLRNIFSDNSQQKSDNISGADSSEFLPAHLQAVLNHPETTLFASILNKSSVYQEMLDDALSSDVGKSLKILAVPNQEMRMRSQFLQSADQVVIDEFINKHILITDMSDQQLNLASTVTNKAGSSLKVMSIDSKAGNLIEIAGVRAQMVAPGFYILERSL